MCTTFSIITPCLNAEKTIGETNRSVISQQGRFRIQYIIVDGGSSDKTREIINDYSASVLSPAIRRMNAGVTVTPVFEPDKGMYEALTKGFSKASGDIIAYINADDFYLPGAFDAVQHAFSCHPDVQWLSGIISVYNSDGAFRYCYTPFVYKSQYIRKGLYNGIVFPFVPQENTFWRAGLMGQINLKRLGSYQLAGDYYLWHEFSKHAQLYHLQSKLAGFRIYPDQKSAEKKKYRNELKKIASLKITFKDLGALLIHKIMWHLPASIKHRYHKYMI